VKAQIVNALVRLGNYISTERGFLRASTIGLGVPAAALGAWTFADYGEAASLFAIPAALVGAYLWGLIMWRLMFRDLYARKRAMVSGAATTGSSQHRSS
jgi:hypothetical protein